VADFDEDGHSDLVVPNVYSDDVAILLGNWKEIDVEIDCPLSKIPLGGTLPFSITLTNKTDSTVTFDVTLWAKLVGEPEILLFGPRTITLTGEKEIIRSPSIGVPVNAPLGDYILSLEAKSLADEVIDEDSFRVTVVGLDDLVAVEQEVPDHLTGIHKRECPVGEGHFSKCLACYLTTDFKR
jgi:hypothetical protein